MFIKRLVNSGLKWLILLVLLNGCIGDSKIRKVRYERDYQIEWCDLHNGKTEVVFADKTRCDCLTSDYAVEVDFAPKWAEAIGQSLNYARQSGKQAGIVLICRSSKDRSKLDILKNNIKFYKLQIRVWSVDC
jgi:hypothetical protein